MQHCLAATADRTFNLSLTQVDALNGATIVVNQNGTTQSSLSPRTTSTYTARMPDGGRASVSLGSDKKIRAIIFDAHTGQVLLVDPGAHFPQSVFHTQVLANSFG